jgi:hypothetical protein
MAPAYSQASLPEAVRVPTGNKVASETVGVGTIVYECRAKADMPGQFAWAFVGPTATLNDRSGKPVGRYAGPPATWTANDGSALTATQVAVAPNGAANLSHQLVKANPATGTGSSLYGVTYIQRVASQGGVAPMALCDASTLNARQTVNYQADYIFYKASM